MTNAECLKEMLRLHKENPNARVVYMVCNEETSDPSEYAYTPQDPVSVELTFLWDDKWGGVFKENDAIDKIFEEIETECDEADEDAGSEAKRLWDCQKYQAIVVWLGAK